VNWATRRQELKNVDFCSTKEWYLFMNPGKHATDLMNGEGGNVTWYTTVGSITEHPAGRRK
jgi:hypothetical protein